MSTRLPQEVQTQKVKTLPDDLKKLAEELLGAKFGEEVIEETHNPFPGQHEFAQTVGIRPDDFFDDFFIEPPMGNRRGVGHRDLGELQVRMEPWSRSKVAELEITYPSYEVLMAALREMDMRNIRTRDRELVMHPEFYHFLMRDRDVSINFIKFDQMGMPRDRGAKVSDGQLFGCQVYITPKVRHAILTARF